jgi:DNA-binding NarL/FixJ family response regulator
VVLEAEGALDRIEAELREQGWTVRRGWTAQEGERRRVCAGVIADENDARAALLAAARGAGVLAHVTASREVLERFFEDLRRCGPVDYLRGDAPASRLSEEQRSLLELLRDGASLGDAAERLHISRRTADRRLAAVRKALGVKTTAEAIARLDGP